MQVIVQALGNDIKNMVVYQDDICLDSATEELNLKTDLILNKLRWSGMTINEKKYIYDGKRISSLGYSISKEGISPYQFIWSQNDIILSTFTSKHSISEILSQEDYPMMYLSRGFRYYLDHYLGSSVSAR